MTTLTFTTEEKRAMARKRRQLCAGSFTQLPIAAGTGWGYGRCPRCCRNIGVTKRGLFCAHKVQSPPTRSTP